MNVLSADHILRALQKRHTRDLWLAEVKDGPSTLVQTSRLDALAIKLSWTQPRLVGYEVKATRSDFLRDNKWATYLASTHQFSFACPANVIQPDELPTEVGLYWATEDGKLKQLRKPAVRPMAELPTNLLYYVIISRFQSDRHPFFSSAREYAMAYADDRPHRKSLGRIVGSRMAEELSVLEHQNKTLQHHVDAWQYRADRLRKALQSAGLPTDEWQLEEALKTLQQNAAASVDLQAVEHLHDGAARILVEIERLRSASRAEAPRV